MKLLSSSLFVFVFVNFVSLSCVLGWTRNGEPNDRRGIVLVEQNLGPWKNEVLEAAQAPAPTNDDPQNKLVLAANRTSRPDILNRFRRYKGGWDISNRHYWASVGFTGAAGLILSILWFVSFAFALAFHHCCGWRINILDEGGSKRSQTLCFVLLIVFTCTATAGCIVLSVGQKEFRDEALDTLKYVVNQSDYTVETLKNVTEYLTLAKSINVAQIFLPSDVLGDIDQLNIDLNAAADTLSEKTIVNSHKIKRVFNAMRFTLVTVATVMLLLALIGLFLSIMQHKHAISIFIIGGWLLVTITFTLCGVSAVLNNSVSDTCMAMKEWVDHSHAETALSNILPCVDQKTTNQTLVQSKKILNDIINVVDQFIYTFANANPPAGNPNYYNQSGPPMPVLCYPFDSQFQASQCGDNEVSTENASTVWENYMCKASESGICTSVGRVTPNIYEQLVGAVNESYALEHYTPRLLSFQDCNFVRDTFKKITTRYCPPLDHYLKIVNLGLAMISVGILLCLVLWLLYANRPRREEVFVKLSFLRKPSVSDTMKIVPSSQNTLTVV